MCGKVVCADPDTKCSTEIGLDVDKVDGQKLKISGYVLQMWGKVSQNKLAAEDISLDNLGRTRMLNAQHVETNLLCTICILFHYGENVASKGSK